jgi:hypothetical protein
MMSKIKTLECVRHFCIEGITVSKIAEQWQRNLKLRLLGRGI